MKLRDLPDQIAPFFFKISEDILVNIFSRLVEDPRHLARLSCVCARFAKVIRSTVCRRQCLRVAPAIVSDLTQGHAAPEPPGGWCALQKLLVCCPGIRHAGVMLDCWDFGLDRELGSSEEFRAGKRKCFVSGEDWCEGKRETLRVQEDASESAAAIARDRVFDVSSAAGAVRQRKREAGFVHRDRGRVNVEEEDLDEAQVPCVETDVQQENFSVERGKLGKGQADAGESYFKKSGRGKSCHIYGGRESFAAESAVLPSYEEYRRGQKDIGLSYENVFAEEGVVEAEHEAPTPADSRIVRVKRKRRAEVRLQDRVMHGACCSHQEPHLACGIWNLTREQGNKLLASRFRADVLYICDWPGCIHPGQRRKYKLFRGVFKNFKASHIWRNLKDLKPRTSGVCCAFCSSTLTWDMVSTFCLRRSHEYHDDGEPVVRAFVCENGHVAGAWTDRPMYIL